MSKNILIIALLFIIALLSFKNYNGRTNESLSNTASFNAPGSATVVDEFDCDSAAMEAEDYKIWMQSLQNQSLADMSKEPASLKIPNDDIDRLYNAIHSSGSLVDHIKCVFGLLNTGTYKRHTVILFPVDVNESRIVMSSGNNIVLQKYIIEDTVQSVNYSTIFGCNK